MKRYLPILLWIAFCVPVFSQSDATADYQALMKAHRAEAQALVKAGEAVAEAQQAYQASIMEAVASQPVNQEDLSRRDLNRRQSQIEWMTTVVPVLVSVTDDPQQAEASMSVWVGAFCQELGLRPESGQAIQASLQNYRSAYGQYWSSYYQVQGMLSGGGSVPPPPPPPPPPPSQQHH